MEIQCRCRRSFTFGPQVLERLWVNMVKCGVNRFAANPAQAWQSDCGATAERPRERPRGSALQPCLSHQLLG